MSLPQVVIDELKRWLADISQTWHYKNSGETGIDIGMHGKIDTPVYAVTSGKVLGSGYYGGGGVISVASNIHYGGINGLASIYYQHLDLNLVKKGETVYAGELIGYSGGQLFGGHHPSSGQFSNGPHIEIGINAPYGAANKSIWSPLGPNVNPENFFKALMRGDTSVLGSNNGGGSSTPPSICDTNPLDPQCIAWKIINQGAGAASTVTDIPSAIAAIPQNLISSIMNAFSAEGQTLGIHGLSDLGWRAVLIILGFVLMLVALLFIGFDLLDRSNIEVAGTRA